jgi:hypothetical protein
LIATILPKWIWQYALKPKRQVPTLHRRFGEDNLLALDTAGKKLDKAINKENCMGNRFLRLAVVYVLLGVGLGIVMAARHNYTLTPVHAHLNLLGWASMALFGLWYRSAPAAAETRLAKIHFWMHNIALPIQMVTLAMVVGGNNSVEPVLALVSIVIGIGFGCFAVNLWKFTS